MIRLLDDNRLSELRISTIVKIIYMRDGRVIWREPELLRLTYQPKKEEVDRLERS
jgi:hypothetical protein